MEENRSAAAVRRKEDHFDSFSINISTIPCTQRALDFISRDDQRSWSDYNPQTTKRLRMATLPLIFKNGAPSGLTDLNVQQLEKFLLHLVENFSAHCSSAIAPVWWPSDVEFSQKPVKPADMSLKKWESVLRMITSSCYRHYGCEFALKPARNHYTEDNSSMKFSGNQVWEGIPTDIAASCSYECEGGESCEPISVGFQSPIVDNIVLGPPESETCNQEISKDILPMIDEGKYPQGKSFFDIELRSCDYPDTLNMGYGEDRKLDLSEYTSISFADKYDKRELFRKINRQCAGATWTNETYFMESLGLMRRPTSKWSQPHDETTVQSSNVPQNRKKKIPGNALNYTAVPFCSPLGGQIFNKSKIPESTIVRKHRKLEQYCLQKPQHEISTVTNAPAAMIRTAK